MRIVLAEEHRGQKLPEKSYNQDIIRVGRNADECSIVFDNVTFPMVSRIHAEMRWQGNNWVLFDANSTFGTYINGAKVIQPQNISVGSKIQFGTNGPILNVIAIGDSPNFVKQVDDSFFGGQSFPPKTPKPVQSSGEKWDEFGQAPAKIQNQPQIPTKLDRQSVINAEIPILEFIDSGVPLAPFRLTKNEIWLGRDPNGDIIFESSKIMVSRQHAQIRKENEKYIIHDNKSFNGTLVNEQRISTPTPLYHDDEIRLGLGGPLLRFKSPSRLAPKGASLAGQRSIAIGQLADLLEIQPQIGSKTMVFKADQISSKPTAINAEPQLLMSLTFGNKHELFIGRGEDSDIHLDGLQISNRHAKLSLTNSGIVIEDLNSTNGVYINGNRISRQNISIDDAVQIGSFVIRVDQASNIGVFDTRSKTRIDSVNVTKDVKNNAGSGMIRLLDNISLSIQPNEFVGLLGPSGAGKSTLMDAMNGMRPASGGSVLINNLDLYQHLDSLKQSIGYVPQDDIIHRELTVYRTLYYVAKLRLSRDVSGKEINEIIDEVLDVTGLTERRDVPINQLSGGQRKRVSIAVELITKPSVIFLDEPTSGLDPATEEKIMILFRQIAESGRTVILTTHAMENVKLFDKLVILMRGKLVFYGTPEEALKHIGATSFKDLYDKLEEPIEEKLKSAGGNRQQITEQVAEDWKEKFTKTPQYRNNVFEPLKELGKLESHGVHKKNRLGIFGAIRQCLTLSKRYTQVLLRDKLTLFILFAQAPIIALLTFLVMGKEQPRDFVYFMISLIAVWFGTSVAAREIIRERAIFKRERMVNLGLLPYLFSKLFVLGFIVGIQCLLVFVPLKFFDLIGLMPMPGLFGGIPQFWVMLLTAGVGIALGLLVSALVKTSEMATSLVPLILIPQILFGGLVSVPQGLNKVAGLAMPATWSFDTVKRYSNLDTLQEEGSFPNGETKGLGLYKFIETENDKIIADAKKELNEYKKDTESKLAEYQRELRSGNNPATPNLSQPPELAEARKIPEDLSRYINFLHPWMHEILNQLVLMVMFGILVIATLIILRLQDLR